MTWTVPAPPTVDGAISGDERAVLAGYLDWQGVTMFNICAGLSAEQLALASAPPSTLTLLGLFAPPREGRSHVVPPARLP